jgi:putative membrane protein
LSAELTSAEKTFITKAAKGNLAEVELGKLASEKSHNQQIKDFGQQMVTDHSKANDNLKPIADSNDVQWSTKLTGEPKALYDKLSTLSGAAFDKTYVGEGLAAQVVRRSDITRSPAAPKPYPVDTAVFR